jgi:O-antigen ligase
MALVLDLESRMTRQRIRLPWTESHDSPGPGAGFWFYALHLATIWGLALSNAFQGLAILWAIFRWKEVKPSAEAFSAAGMAKLLKPFALYAVVFVISVLTSYRVPESAWHLRGLIGLTTLPLAFLLVRGERQVRLLFDVLIWVTLGLAILGIGQYLLTDYGGLDNRIPGAFSHYMTYSGILLVGSCLVLGRVVAGTNGKQLRNWLVLVPILVAMVLTLTRHAWLAAFLVLTIAWLLRFRRLLWVYIASALLLLAFTASVAPEHWSRLRSIGSLEDPSNYDRLCMTYAGVHMIGDAPLFGIGPGMVEYYYPIYRHPTSTRAHVMHLHNTLMQLGAERGLLTVVAYLWLMIAAAILSYRGLKRDGGLSGPRADLYLGTLLTLIAFNFAGIFEANWRDTEVQRWMLFLLAVPCCLPILGRGEIADETAIADDPVGSSSGT